MTVLVGCEKSQRVTIALRNNGINAYSCDLQESTGNIPEYHLQMDIFKAIRQLKPKALIAFPPCTYLSSVQTHLCQKNEIRTLERIKAAMFFMKLYNLKIKHIALENPAGVMKHIFREADQFVHPYYFGGDKLKRTGLWLKGFPKLQYNLQPSLFDEKISGQPGKPVYTYIQKSTGKIKNTYEIMSGNNGDERSVIAQELADAIGEQWGNFLKEKYKLNHGH